jgi:uncharacterized membrane protein YqjE
MANDQTPTSDLGQAVQDISEKASLLIREEIELAKTEMTEKVTSLVKGAVVGIVAGVFAVFALVYLLHSLSFGLFAIVSDDANYIWVGYLIVGGLLLLLGGLAGFLAARFLKGGSPPTPVMAIEEGKLIKETVQSSRPAQPHDSAVTPAGTVRPEARR